MRCSVGGHSYEMTISEQVIHPTETLVAQCLKSGQSSERAPGILQYEFNHSSGIIIHYVNKSEKLILHEEINFDMEGLKLENSPTEKSVQFTLPPSETMTILLS